MVCTGRAGAVTVFTGLTLPQGGCRACITLQQSMRLTPCGKVSKMADTRTSKQQIYSICNSLN